MTEAGQTVCLCMIVKNEEHVIRRCLGSLLPLIDAWLIVDTGSTDGTQACIRDFLKDVPGELVERPWVDFAHNRSESLRLARHRADYVLVIDADEYLECASDFVLPPLIADAYDFPLLSGPLAYYKTQLVRDALDWRFQGVLHEHIVTDHPATRERMAGVRTIRIMDGARSRDPMTYRRDALILEEAVLREPDNARHMFYLAQSYMDAGEAELAIDRYSRRVAMGGWMEEVWYALYQIARLKELRRHDWPAVQEAYLAAFNARPDRAEPLFRVGMHYQQLRQFPLAHLFFSRGLHIPYPAQDLLFVECEVYDYLLPLEYAVACFYIGEHASAIATLNGLLEKPGLTAEQVEQVTRNRQFSLDVLATVQVST